MTSESNRMPGPPGARPRRTIASYPDYRDAERAVDRLADREFPVERVAIVGQGLKTVEQVTGRIGWWDAALRGLLSGAIAGALIGWLFAVFDWFNPLVARGWLILDGLWFGALVGLAFGLLAHALTHGRRYFSSIGGLQAERYDVVVDAAVADEAVRLLNAPDGDDRRPEADRAAAEQPTMRGTA